jgi:hypothetical protein
MGFKSSDDNEVVARSFPFGPLTTGCFSPLRFIQHFITKQHQSKQRQSFLFVTSLSSLAALHQIRALGGHTFSSQVLQLPKMASSYSNNDSFAILNPAVDFAHDAGPVNEQPRANTPSDDKSGGDRENPVQRTTAPDTSTHNSALDGQKGNIQESMDAQAGTMHSGGPEAQKARSISSWGTVRNIRAREFREACREAQAHLSYGIECLQDGVER